MPIGLSLEILRHRFDQKWIIVTAGIAYLISQLTILIILGPIAEAMFRLQLLGVSASDYISAFTAWQQSGEIAYYRAHFILDDCHWLWYSIFFTALLAFLFNRCDVPANRNWFLLLPFASGFLDWFENRLQHVFLNTSDFTTIFDPLPLASTLASGAKWLLALSYISVSVVLLLRLQAGTTSKVSA